MILHMHIFLWLDNKIMPADIDKVISTEIPDPGCEAVLYEIVTKDKRFTDHVAASTLTLCVW